jgi:hypothetical protein
VQKLDPGDFEAGIAQLSRIYGFKCGYEMLGRSTLSCSARRAEAGLATEKRSYFAGEFYGSLQ